MTEPCDLSAVAARTLIGERELSPVELMESCIRRIESIDPAVNAIIAEQVLVGYASLTHPGHPTKRLPPLQHDLAARFSRLQERMCALEVGGVDGAEGLVERGAQHALVEEVGNVVQQMMLRDHVRGLE